MIVCSRPADGALGGTKSVGARDCRLPQLAAVPCLQTRGSNGGACGANSQCKESCGSIRRLAAFSNSAGKQGDGNPQPLHVRDPTRSVRTDVKDAARTCMLEQGREGRGFAERSKGEYSQ